jgi:hypothetical protein
MNRAVSTTLAIGAALALISACGAETPDGQGTLDEATQAAAGTRNYFVQQGDTLFEIAQTHCTTVETVHALNPSIVNVDKIGVGELLHLPFTRHDDQGEALLMAMANGRDDEVLALLSSRFRDRVVSRAFEVAFEWIATPKQFGDTHLFVHVNGACVSVRDDSSGKRASSVIASPNGSQGLMFEDFSFAVDRTYQAYLSAKP